MNLQAWNDQVKAMAMTTSILGHEFVGLPMGGSKDGKLRGPRVRNDLKGFIFNNCHFKDCDFSYMTLAYGLFKDCELERCNLEGVTFKRVSMMECSITGCSFEQADISGTVMTNVTVWDSSFYNCVMDKVVAMGGSWVTCLMQGATLDRGVIEGLKRANTGMYCAGSVMGYEGIGIISEDNALWIEFCGHWMSARHWRAALAERFDENAICGDAGTQAEYRKMISALEILAAGDEPSRDKWMQYSRCKVFAGKEIG